MAQMPVKDHFVRMPRIALAPSLTMCSMDFESLRRARTC
jgi:hypothetical protein